jgi:hypothetical protein
MRSFSCEDSFDVLSLRNYSFLVYGFENGHLNGLFSSNLIKYKLYPFKEVVQKPTKSMPNDNVKDVLVYEYVVPIYNFEVKLELSDGKKLVGKNNLLNIKEISCFNRMVFALNEARYLDNIKVVNYLTEQDIINFFRLNV